MCYARTNDEDERPFKIMNSRIVRHRCSISESTLFQFMTTTRKNQTLLQHHGVEGKPKKNILCFAYKKNEQSTFKSQEEKTRKEQLRSIIFSPSTRRQNPKAQRNSSQEGASRRSYNRPMVNYSS